MNRKIEKQKERAVLESGARQLTMEDRARLEAIKVRGMPVAAGTSCGLLSCTNSTMGLEASKVRGALATADP